tara:strand:+ start:311 stop:1297 length:987 start_codon:yes stop_codon:yes gene_type:complete
MANTFDIRMDLRNLTDEDLHRAIEDQENLILRTPSVELAIMPALREYRTERDRRQDEKINAIVDDVIRGPELEAMPEPVRVRVREPEPESEPAPDVEMAALRRSPSTVINVYSTPDKNLTHKHRRVVRSKTITEGRSKRMRSVTEHYDPSSKLLACETKQVGFRPQSIRDRMRKHPEFSATMAQFDTNKTIIKRQALKLACPLLCADEVRKGKYNENDPEFLLRTQAKQVAMAADGIQYDFSRIKAYIRESCMKGIMLRSPVTGEEMSGEVRFTQPVTNRWGNVVFVGQGEEKLPKLEVKTWEPGLNAYKRTEKPGDRPTHNHEYAVV